ncbi:MAG: hypothetical protein JEY94_11840 [Melioribacteraceae bacterium]|nr:hypothetical protein [Melioribacteraceae bacterium]
MLDLRKYNITKKDDKSVSITRIFSKLQRKQRFDIYDYNMLFQDEKTKKIIRNGSTLGCFYIESPGMRSLLKKLNCDTFEMLVAASSIIRPGVAESGMMQEFIARHKDPQKRKYLVPEMEKYLGESYGVMIYQEDVIKVAHHIAGLSLEEADLLRRAMSGKMRSSKTMELLHDNFFLTAKGKKLPDDIIKELWRQISSFAGYAFCKAHSASFALLSFQVAYLKAHYPAEFLASVLSNRGGYYSAAVYIHECKRLGLNVFLPCVNKSKIKYYGKDKYLSIGLMAVKRLSRKTMLNITGERAKNGKYTSLGDFVDRVDIAPKETELLIKCGAFDFLEQSRPALMWLSYFCFKSKNTIQYSLFDNEEYLLSQGFMNIPQYQVAQICAVEYETFGFLVSHHPLDFFAKFINHKKIVKAKDMSNYNGKVIKMIGWFMTSKRIKTRKGKIMKFLSLEDLSGTFEAVLFPNVYSLYAEETLSAGAFGIVGRVDTDNGNNIVVERIKALSTKELQTEQTKDSAENIYYGEVDAVHDEEFELSKSLNKKIINSLYGKGA